MDTKSVRERLEAAFQHLVSKNGFSGSPPTVYRFDAEPLSVGGSGFNLTLTFLAERTYCCFEQSCHLPLKFHVWTALRNHLREIGWEPAAPMRIPEFTVHVEAGAIELGDDLFNLVREPIPWEYELGPQVELDREPESRRATLTLKESHELLDRRCEEEFRSLEVAVETHPGDPRLWSRLARNRIPHDLDGAIRDLRTAIRFSPADPFLRGSLIRILVLWGRLREAASERDAVLAVWPNLEWAKRLGPERIQEIYAETEAAIRSWEERRARGFTLSPARRRWLWS